MTQKYAITQARLRNLPGGQPGSTVLVEVPQGHIVEFTGNETSSVYNGILSPWIQIVYSAAGRTWGGWSYAAFFNDYEAPRPVVKIENPTDEINDAAQYVIFRGIKQVNLCGELSVAYLVGCSLGELLQKWEPHAPTVFNRIFQGGKGSVTGIPDLHSMLSAFDVPTPCLTLADGLRDPILERALVSPQRVERMLQSHRAIVSVKIETQFGRLRPSGVGHWVVLENVYAHGIDNGAVEIYNPFSNSMEGYTWNEFTQSAKLGYPLGIWVER